MSETAAGAPLTDAAHDAELQQGARERLGVAAFVVLAVVATAGWLGLLLWLAFKLVSAL